MTCWFEVKYAISKTHISGLNLKINSKNKKPNMMANHKYIFEKIPILNIDSCDLQLNPWSSLDKQSVANAMVLAAIWSPVDNPIWKAAIVPMVMSNPSINTSTPKDLFNIGEFISLGFSFIIFLLWGSSPIAIAGRLSVTKLIKRRCTGAKGIGSAASEA